MLEKKVLKGKEFNDPNQSAKNYYITLGILYDNKEIIKLNDSQKAFKFIPLSDLFSSDEIKDIEKNYIMFHPDFEDKIKLFLEKIGKRNLFLETFDKLIFFDLTKLSPPVIKKIIGSIYKSGYNHCVLLYNKNTELIEGNTPDDIPNFMRKYFQISKREIYEYDHTQNANAIYIRFNKLNEINIQKDFSEYINIISNRTAWIVKYLALKQNDQNRADLRNLYLKMKYDSNTTCDILRRKISLNVDVKSPSIPFYMLVDILEKVVSGWGIVIDCILGKPSHLDGNLTMITEIPSEIIELLENIEEFQYIFCKLNALLMNQDLIKKSNPNPKKKSSKSPNKQEISINMSDIYGVSAINEFDKNLFLQTFELLSQTKDKIMENFTKTHNKLMNSKAESNNPFKNTNLFTMFNQLYAITTLLFVCNGSILSFGLNRFEQKIDSLDPRLNTIQTILQPE